VTEPLATLVDTNVIFDVLYDDPVWAEWSTLQLDAAALRGAVAINDIVYAELSVRFESIEALDQTVADMELMIAPMPRSALFMAGKVFARYRALGGVRTSILPDFILGAHASTLAVPLLSRDARRYRTYFPRLELIAP
jgi:predicted nucleic acid-binding protein